MLADLPQRLAACLAQGLPGAAAQRGFEPELAYGRHFGPPACDARPAAVLLLLYPHAGCWQMPLVLRPETLTHHGGQISLPGGSVDLGETTQQAALRELHEELGVAPSGVHLIGPLSPLYLFVTNFHITPWLAYCSDRPRLAPCAFEVAALLETPLSALTDPQHRSRHCRQLRGLSFSAPCLRWQGYEIWGATAMILGELIALLSVSAPDYFGGTTDCRV